MSRPDTWMPFYIGDYLADTGHLARDEHGGYVLLLFAAWTRGGKLPGDDAQLARLAKATPAEWKRLRPVLAPFFAVSADAWVQARLLREFESSTERKAKAEAKAKAAADKRWGRDAPSIPPSNAPSTPQAMQEECPPSPSPSTKAKASAARKRALPPDFAISDRVREWAADKGHEQLQFRLEHFIGKAKAKGYAYADWDEAFMGAIRDDWAGLNNAKQGNSTTEKRAATAAAMLQNQQGNHEPTDITAEVVRVA